MRKILDELSKWIRIFKKRLISLMINIRDENKIFSELSELCGQPGYIYVIAYFSLRDNFSISENKLPAIDDHNNKELLLRTEISALLGLLCKCDIDLTIPTSDKFSLMVKNTESLMKEMHDCISAPMFAHLKNPTESLTSNNIDFGSFIREGIFYGPESAYSFQYLNFFSQKYKNDDNWINTHKNFSVGDAKKIIADALEVQQEKISNFIDNHNGFSFADMLSAFTITTEELVTRSAVNKAAIQALLKSFTFPKENKNELFLTLSDYNAANTHPLIEVDHEKFLLFQLYTLVESLYDSPFYWMIKDKNYQDSLSKNRGCFTEEITEAFLRRVFGEKSVIKNVKIKNKKDVAGEIDILVLYADNAIIFQTKSKRLTIEAKKGNDGKIKDDFKQAIGDAYEQSLSCARFLKNEEYLLYDSKDNVIHHANINDIFLVCIVCDHYPALSAQVRQLLTIKNERGIFPPLAIDIFFLDILTEFLSTPLYFLSYLQIRSEYGERFIATNELTIFSYHLKRNLWLDSNVQMALVDQSFTSYVDEAMVVRRFGASGEHTPEGILTRYSGTRISQLINQISTCDNATAMNLGMLLLRFSEEAMFRFNDALNHIIEKASQKGNSDCSLPVSDFESGITVHCNDRNDSEAQEALSCHCQLRKYKQKAKSWYGICFNLNGSIRFCVEYNEPWQKSDELEKAIKKYNL